MSTTKWNATIIKESRHTQINLPPLFKTLQFWLDWRLGTRGSPLRKIESDSWSCFPLAQWTFSIGIATTTLINEPPLFMEPRSLCFWNSYSSLEDLKGFPSSLFIHCSNFYWAISLNLSFIRKQTSLGTFFTSSYMPALSS